MRSFKYESVSYQSLPKVVQPSISIADTDDQCLALPSPFPRAFELSLLPFLRQHNRWSCESELYQPFLASPFLEL